MWISKSNSNFGAINSKKCYTPANNTYKTRVAESNDNSLPNDHQFMAIIVTQGLKKYTPTVNYVAHFCKKGRMKQSEMASDVFRRTAIRCL